LGTHEVLQGRWRMPVRPAAVLLRRRGDGR
jgi:hypothetical protein